MMHMLFSLQLIDREFVKKQSWYVDLKSMVGREEDPGSDGWFACNEWLALYSSEYVCRQLAREVGGYTHLGVSLCA